MQSIKTKNFAVHPSEIKVNLKKDLMLLHEIIFELKRKFNVSDKFIDDLKTVHNIFPIKINPYYFNLIQERNDPIWKQCIPDIKELLDITGEVDPLAEERDSPTELITHRYPDRVLFLISDDCAMLCRFCTRKRKVGTTRLIITKEKILKSIEYIKNHPEIRDVILSGGDALLTPYNLLEFTLKKIREIPHIEIVRLGTRLPCTNPSKITPKLCTMLKRYHPLFINVHFEHPMEITIESIKACNLLANAGIPLGNQNVLLKDINDDPIILKSLYQQLLQMRVKPYYLFQADYVLGTNHFRTTVEKGIEMIKNLRGFISGLAIPHYVIDAPDGGGKIPVLPKYLKSINEKEVILTNYQDKLCIYPQP